MVGIPLRRDPKGKGKGTSTQKPRNYLRCFLWISKRELPFGQGFAGGDPPPEERGVVAITLLGFSKGKRNPGGKPRGKGLSPCPFPH